MHGLSPQRPARQPFAMIVDEALGAVLAPDRRADVLFDALSIAGLTEVPDRPTSMRIFVEGALFSALSRQLDLNDALELVAQIRSTLELALANEHQDRPTSDVHPRRISFRPGPARALVVTQASLVVFLLQDMIGDHVEVLPISNEGDLRDRLTRLRGENVLTIIDRKHPCVDPDVCDLLKSELGADSTVVWWGASAVEHRRVKMQLADGPRLVACELDLRLADLGDLCRDLLGDPPA